MVTLRFILTRIYYVIALLPLLNIRRLVNFTAAVVRFLLKTERSTKHPAVVILDITNDCNFKCVMCWKNDSAIDDHLMDYKNVREMEFETLKKFLTEHGPYISLVRLHGGEPLHYSRIKDLLDLLNTSKVPYNIVTNGSLLTGDILEKVVDTTCVGLGFSLDTADPEVFGKIRTGGSLDTVLANIDAVNLMKKEKRSRRPVLSASMCAFSFNISGMADLVELCRKHEIPALSVAEGEDLRTPGIEEDHLIRNNTDTAVLAIKEARAAAKKNKVILRLRFPSLQKSKELGFHQGNVRPRNCVNLYASAWLLPDLRIIGCSSTKVPLGLMTEKPFHEIWNGKDTSYAAMRKTFRQGKTPDNCVDCVYTGGFFS